MNWVGRKGFWMAALLGVSQQLSAAPAVPSAVSHSASGGVHLSVPPEPSSLVPPLPSPKSPVAFFRELLAMNALERKKALAERSPENQKVILAKVREYASLDPDLREERLQVTEMRWYLLPLMMAPATNRAAQLAAVPARSRQFVEDRLRAWDKLPSDVQKELLANEATIRYFTEIEGRTEEQRRKILEALSPARRQKLQKGIEQWNRLPEDQHRKITSRFYQFFDLTAEDKEKALRTLSAPERRQIEKTLRTFGSLPPDQRAKCVHAFEKFAGLSLEERQQFLKNAERWKLLTPSQRQAWRDLVNKLPPPLPPDLPPLPPSHPSPRPAPAVATKGH
jgi:hypothetical protein